MSGGRRPSKALRFVLVGIGSLVIISALVNIVSAGMLIEPSDEQSLGITRKEIFVQYGAGFIAGATLVWLGLRRK